MLSLRKGIKMHQKCQSSYMRSWKTLLVVVAMVLTIFSSLFFNSASTYAGVRNEPNQDVTEVGDVLQWLMPTLAFGSTFIVRGPDGKLWDKEGTWQFTKSFGSTVLTTSALKLIAGKWRPQAFSGIDEPSDKSFPSGHTSSTFSSAAFINTRYGPWFGVPAYAAAFFTAYSRVQADAHFLDDVTAGASIAVLYNFLWVTPQSWSGKYAIMPLAKNDTTGVQVTMKLGDTPEPDSEEKKPKKKPNRYRFNFGFGPAFTLKNEITSPTSTGTTFDLSKFEDSDDIMTTSAVQFDIFLGKRHEVNIFWLPFENRDVGFFTQDVFFAGQVYPANTNIISAWRQNEIKGVYRYNFTPEDKWQFKAGGGFFVQNTNIALATEGFAIESEVEDWVVLPVVHGSVGYKLTPKWTFSVGADGMYLSEDTYFDVVASINYRISHHWDATLGYEYYARDIEKSDLTNHTVLSIPYIAVAYSW